MTDKQKIIEMLENPDPNIRELGLSLAESQSIDISDYLIGKKDQLVSFFNILKDNGTSSGSNYLPDSYENLTYKEVLEAVQTNYLFISGIIIKQKLRRVPPQIIIFNGIQKLALIALDLKELPDELSSFQNLEVLDIGDNQFTQIPNVIFGMEKLKELNLSNNPFKYIPEGIKKLENLESLYLSYCYIKNIEEVRSWLPNCNIHYVEFKEELWIIKQIKGLWRRIKGIMYEILRCANQ